MELASHSASVTSVLRAGETGSAAAAPKQFGAMWMMRGARPNSPAITTRVLSSSPLSCRSSSSSRPRPREIRGARDGSRPQTRPGQIRVAGNLARFGPTHFAKSNLLNQGAADS